MIFDSEDNLVGDVRQLGMGEGVRQGEALTFNSNTKNIVQLGPNLSLGLSTHSQPPTIAGGQDMVCRLHIVQSKFT